MHNLLTYSIFVALLLAVCSAVSLDDLMGNQPENPADQVIDDAAAETLDELEVTVFEEIIDAEMNRKRTTMSPKKCCKIGKKVAEAGLYCNIDLMQVQKKNNNVFKRKMKWQGPDADVGKRQHKDLLMRVEKCYPAKSSRSMFMKCCQLQQSRQDELEDCKKLPTRDERKACRRNAKGKGDY
ncbi:uncharacterized protein [Amphiura filiformis]|uniref:uncharacterized protein n=1 Tax=Amphiura filiformis TaxID=82378 RepID=UPI003B2104AD